MTTPALTQEMVRDLGTFIVAQGMASGIGTDVFLDNRPPTPIRCLAITDTGGYPQPAGLDDLSRTAQIMCRDEGAAKAKAWAWQVYRLLSPAGGKLVVVDGRKMVTIGVQPPFSIGPDETGRALWAFNLTIVARPDE